MRDYEYQCNTAFKIKWMLFPGCWFARVWRSYKSACRGYGCCRTSPYTFLCQSSIIFRGTEIWKTAQLKQTSQTIHCILRLSSSYLMMQPLTQMVVLTSMWCYLHQNSSRSSRKYYNSFPPKAASHDAFTSSGLGALFSQLPHWFQWAFSAGLWVAKAGFEIYSQQKTTCSSNIIFNNSSSQNTFPFFIFHKLNNTVN